MGMTFLQVGLGGAIGAMLRFGLAALLLRAPVPGVPVAILTVNVLGSFLMGIVFVISLERDLTYLNPFVMSGVLGGFTTFSAFSLEAFSLYERGEAGMALLYVGLSVIGSVGALALGVWMARGLVS